MPLACLRQAVLAARLLPESESRYQPLLADGLCFFLERLPAARLRGIFAEQASLPLSTATEQRLMLLLQHMPTLHKLGQVMSRDRRLNPAFRSRLQQLESMESSTDRRGLERMLTTALPGWQRIGIQIAAKPLAEGSVAVVAPFTSKNGRQQSGVLKILKPGIEKRLNQELRIWSDLGAFLEEECERYHLPRLDYQEVFETVRDLLMHEVRLEHEQQHLVDARRELAGIPGVRVPKVLPFCSPRLTAMERLPGEPLTARLEEHRPLKMATQAALAHALVAQPIFSRSDAALFHGDPHAGNVLVSTDEELGILDWSLTGRLAKRAREQLAQMLVGGLLLDRERILRAAAELSRAVVGTQAINVVQESLAELHPRNPPGVNWFTGLLDRLVIEGGVKFAPDLLLFRKSLLTFQGILADMARAGEAGACVLDFALLGAFLENTTKEWQQRWWTPWDARSFRTHLSTADWLGLWCLAPAAWMRYCHQWWGDRAVLKPR